MLEPLKRDEHETVDITVIIGAKDWAGGVPSIAYIGQFGLPWDEARYVRDEVEKLIHRRSTMFTLHVDGDNYNWGAATGPVETIALFIGETALDAAFAALIATLFDKLATIQRRRKSQTEDWREEYSPDEAISQARWVVSSKFLRHAHASDSLPSHEDLQLIADQHDLDAGTHSVAFRDTQGVRYEVVIGAVNGIPSVTSVKRSYPNGLS